jgi:hypothetical protein
MRRKYLSPMMSEAGLSFYLPLLNVLTPFKAVSATPTFSRATTAYVPDWESVQKQAISGEVRFQGARRVRNLCSTSLPASWLTASNMTATTGVSDPLGGTSAVTFTATALGAYMLDSLTLATGVQVRNSLWIRRRTGTGTVSMHDGSDSDGVTNITTIITTTWQRIATAVKTAAGAGSNDIGIAITSSGDAIDIWHPQMEAVSGQTNQNPSEYVSVGVLSTPWNGANVDGVQYFLTRNGNTVASNVVTEATGTALTMPLGYLSEGARTNLLVQSNDLTNAAWVKTTMTTAKTSVGPDGLVNGATRCTASAGNALVLQTITAAASSRTLSFWVKRITGTGNFDLTQDGLTFTTVTTTAAWTQVQLNASKLNAAVGFRIVTNADAFDIWCGQFEAGAFASSPIPTVAATVTRNADVLTFPISGNVGVTAGSAYAEYSTNWQTAAADSIVGAIADTSGIFGYTFATSPSTQINANDGTNSPGISSTDPYHAAKKFATSWGSNFNVVVGATVNTTAFAGNMGAGGSTKIGVGVEPTASNKQLYGTIRNLKLYLIALPNSVLTAMTT